MDDGRWSTSVSVQGVTNNTQDQEMDSTMMYVDAGVIPSFMDAEVSEESEDVEEDQQTDELVLDQGIERILVLSSFYI